MCVRTTSLVRQFAKILRRRVTTYDLIGLRAQRRFVDDRVRLFAWNACLLASGVRKYMVGIDSFIKK